MKILLTGGLGFQGQHLARHWLQEGHAVVLLNTPSERAAMTAARMVDAEASTERLRRLRVVWGSVTDPEVVQKTVAGCDAIVHLAAWTSVDESFTHPRATWNVNADAAYTVLEAIRLHAPQARVLFASSCEVYGHTGESLPITEDGPLRPHSPYAASKAAGDRLAHSYALTFDLDLAILRPCNIFGPWQKAGPGGAVIPTFLAVARRGLPLTVTGTGAQRREFLYVEDLVEAYAMVLEGDWSPGSVFNAGSGETRSIMEIALAVGERYGVRAVCDSSVARPGEVYAFRLDSSRLRALGWKPQWSFTMGLEATMQWAEREGDPHV